MAVVMEPKLSAGTSLRADSLKLRVANTRKAMAEKGIDLLVAYHGGTYGLGGINGVLYLAGHRNMGKAAVLLPADGEATVITTPAWDGRRAKEDSQFADVVASDDLWAALTQALGRRKAGKIGLTVSSANKADSDRLQSALGSPADATELLTNVAMVRDPWQMELVRKASWIGEMGWQWIVENVHAGMKEYKAQAGAELRMRELGADDNFFFFCASVHNTGPRAPQDRVLEKGEIILAEITPSVNGVSAQLCRTGVIGGPAPLHREKWGLLDQGLRAGVKLAKAGGVVKDAVAAVNKPLVDAGYGALCQPPYMSTRGHSMQTISPGPSLTPNNEGTFVKGSAFVLHPNQYIPETGYLMCGEPMVVEDGEGKILTSGYGVIAAVGV